MKITIETLNTMDNSKIMELFFSEFLNYGKKCSKYIAHNHGMSADYCASYIASGLFDLFLKRCEKLHENENGYEFSRETMLISFFGTMKLIKKIGAMTNYSSYFKSNKKAYEAGPDTVYKLKAYKNTKNKYSEYRNVKKVNSHIIDIVDILEQKENRCYKYNVSLETDIFENVSMRDTLKSYYPTPEQDLLNKLSRVYSHKMAIKIRSDKSADILEIVALKISASEPLTPKEKMSIQRLKERCGLTELKTKDILYIVKNY